MPRRVVITGAGALTPIGNTALDFWNALLAGESGVDHVKCISVDAYNCKVAAEVKNFDPTKYLNPKQARKTDRFVQFGVYCAGMALEDSQIDLSKEDPHRIGVLVGSGIGGLHTIEEQCRIMLERGPSRVSPFLIPMLIVNMAPGMISIQYKLKGPNSCVATACATGTHAVGDAFRLIQHGDADMMLAGGTEACITLLGFGGFDRMSALTTHNEDPRTASRPFDKTRDGFVMGEGCGIVFLEELEHAKNRNAHIYAEVVGYGLTADANHITAPDPEGDGPTQCMLRAIKDAQAKPADIDYINAHGTSTVLNDKTETLAIRKALGDHAYKVMISSTKSMTGHLLGAAGGIETIACAFTIKNQIIAPTINYKHPDPDCDLDYVPNEARRATVKYALSNSFGFGGHNATLCFKRFED
ncbi:MAG: beta-ketoacyl-ACP synthase II [Candidatus Omnitrophica bacterium]|nr:beta-ketoacyl-ACP synthase II [Candidatus Omnitrophota bacterium]